MQTRHLTIVAKAPTARGTFDGTIDANPPAGDHDGERIADWTNVPGTFPLIYSHNRNDPGAEIGEIDVRPVSGGKLFVTGRLDIKKNAIATAVHERMMLPDSDPMSLGELSVGFAFDTSLVTKDPNGVHAIHEAKLLEVSVVYRGAQTTSVTNVKVGARNSSADLATIQQIHDEAMQLGAVCPAGEYGPKTLSRGDREELGDLALQLTAIERDIETRRRLSRTERSITIEGRVDELVRDTDRDQRLRDLEHDLKRGRDLKKRLEAETRREVYGPPKRRVTAISSDPAGRSREAVGQV